MVGTPAQHQLLRVDKQGTLLSELCPWDFDLCSLALGLRDPVLGGEWGSGAVCLSAAGWQLLFCTWPVGSPGASRGWGTCMLLDGGCEGHSLLTSPCHQLPCPAPSLPQPPPSRRLCSLLEAGLT